MYNGTAVVLQAEYIYIYHGVLSPPVGKHIGNKMPMLFLLQRRLTLFTKSCFFKGFQKHSEADKGKAESVISVPVPAVPDNVKLPHIVLRNLTSSSPAVLLMQEVISAGCAGALHVGACTSVRKAGAHLHRV